eukprot:jgi/Phyca11/99013/e_gw1.3.1027.1
MMSELEEKVRILYPFLLTEDSILTTDSWVLDSGCGHGLTSEITRFVSKRSNSQYMFTFAQGSKHSNTHIGTIKLYLRGPNGIKPFLFDNIAMVPHSTSDILSEFWLRCSGYQILGSLRGKFKFVLYDNEFEFVAKAINGAYYLQNITLLERKNFCDAVKTKPCKPLSDLEIGRYERILQEWHVKLVNLNGSFLKTQIPFWSYQTKHKRFNDSCVFQFGPRREICTGCLPPPTEWYGVLCCKDTHAKYIILELEPKIHVL